jgi:hypothetical protein
MNESWGQRALSDLAAWICLRFAPATGQMAARTARGTGADDQ